MRLPRAQFTIGQCTVLICVVGLVLGIWAWVNWNPGVFLLAAVISLIAWLDQS